MASASPIFRFGLEIFHHALENYASEQPRHRKVAVLSMAQAVELLIKAALVEKNVPIYGKDGRTVRIHEALSELAFLWGEKRIDYHARAELLVDERNAFQHRYGSVDDVSLDYHLETAYGILRQILEREFDTDIDGWVHDTVDPSVWRKIRFVEASEVTNHAPSEAVQMDRSAVIDFIDGFSRFEHQVRSRLTQFLNEGEQFSGSTLDFSIKALSNAPVPDGAVITALPGVYKLRNQVIHGDYIPETQMVQNVLRVLDSAVNALADVPADVLERAYRATMRGVRGTHLPTRLEEAEQSFTFEDPPNSPESGN